MLVIEAVESLNPSEPYTDGETVVFRCYVEKIEGEYVKRHEKATERIVEVFNGGI